MRIFYTDAHRCEFNIIIIHKEHRDNRIYIYTLLYYIIILKFGNHGGECVKT